MEAKEKQKVFAQTFVPSIGIFEDKPGPIQLASKAKDCNAVVTDKAKMSFKHNMQKKYAQSLANQNANASTKSHDASKSGSPSLKTDLTPQEKIIKMPPGDPNNMFRDSRSSDRISPLIAYDMKQNGARFLPPKPKCPSPKPNATHKEMRNVTSISACTWTPEAANGNTGSDLEKLRDSGAEHPMEARCRSNSLSSDSKDVKQPPGFYRSFQVQPGRPAMKLERNRGQHKLPVGIAVARQRLHATPTKQKGAPKSISPEAERRHHEHALNQEREVLLRENKELSNFTSRLQTSSSTSGLPMLSVPNPVLPAWDREQALMASSLLQWQAQHSLLNSSLQHPSMWFGGSPSYHIPTQQSGSAMPTAPSPTSGYPVLGGGIPGGFVIMPQFLEGGAPGMWSPVALYGNAHSASRALAHSFPSLLSQQLNLQPHELQTWQQQQALLRQGLSLSMHKGEAQHGGEKNRHRSPTPSYARKTDSIDCRSPAAHYRYSVSPKNTHKDIKPQLDLRQPSPLCSPPSRSQYHKRKPSPYQEATVPTLLPRDTTPRHGCTSPDSIPARHSRRGQEAMLPNYRGDGQYRAADLRPAAPINHHVLDLTSSPSDVPDSRALLKCESAPRTQTPAFSPQSKPLPIKHDVTLPAKVVIGPTRQTVHPPSPVPLQNIERQTVPNGVKLEVEPEYRPEDNVSANRSPHDSAGVELLTKAADIHLKHMSVVPPQVRQDHPPENAADCPPQQKNINNLNIIQPSDQNVDTSPPSPERQVNVTLLTPAAQEVEPDVDAIDPDVLDAVRGITLLSHASFDRFRQKHEQKEPTPPELPDHRDHVSEPAHSTCGDYNDEVQSTVSYSSVPDPTIFSGDGMSSSELKERDSSCERVRLKRKLNHPISSKLKFSKEEETSPNTGIKLDSMEAMEVDMKMRLADLQRRYKEKQKELAKLQRRNRTETKQHAASSSSTLVPSSSLDNVSAMCSVRGHDFSALKSDFWQKTNNQKHTSSAQVKQSFRGEFPCHSATLPLPGGKRRKIAEAEKHDSMRSKPKTSAKRTSEKHEKKQKDAEKNFSVTDKRVTTESPNNHGLSSVTSEENETENGLDFHQMPSGSRKRKADKPKRICIPFGERPTVPLVEPAKKNIGNSVLFKNMEVDGIKSEKKRKRKLKQAKKKLKREEESAVTGEHAESAFSSWVFKSSNKMEKHEKKILQSAKKAEKEKSKLQKAQKKVSNSANLSNNNNTRKKSTSFNEEKVQGSNGDTARDQESAAEEKKMPVFTADRLELREEDLVKGLQVLVPLEDKLLYLCQINPIQPPDIYEVTVEGERHRHRPIVMCLEQILSEAVPDVKPKSRDELCEGSRVAAYWSHKMHCLYTGTIAFDDSDCEDEAEGDGELVQVEFDDGDSSMIPLEDIRLLPRNYPIMQPEAPFMMHYINRRRNTSEISMQSKDGAKVAQNKNKKQTEKKEKHEEKSRKSSTKLSTKQKSSLDLSAYDYRSADEAAPSRKRSFLRDGAKPTKPTASANATETSSSSVSSADEDSDTVFSDSSDDTYEGNDNDHGPVSNIGEKRLPPKCNRKQTHPINELWAWYDKDVQKKVVKGKAKKIYHKSINRGDEVISCGDSAVFLSSGRLYLPYIGRIESMWESWGDNMVVKVRWFYHPEETKGGRLKSHGKHPLYKSSHIDENDVQTISHKCEVVSFKEYNRRMRNGERNIFYCTGIYDPATGQVTQEYSDRRKHQKS